MTFNVKDLPAGWAEKPTVQLKLKAAKAHMESAQKIADDARAAGREPTPDEWDKINGAVKAADDVKAWLTRAAEDAALLAAMEATGPRPDDLRAAGAAPAGQKFDQPHRLSFAHTQAAVAVVNLAAKAGGRGVKSLLTVGSSASLPADVLAGTIVPEGRPAFSVFELIPAVKVDGGQFSFLRQTARDLRAAPVAKGATKPTSTAAITRVTGELSIVAHVLEGIHTYDLADAPALATFVRDEMGYGLGIAVANQVFSGDGAAPNLRGILNTSGVRTQAFAVNPAVTVRRSLTQLEVAGYAPAGVFMHPTDWDTLETTQLTDGAFLLGQGTNGAPLDAVERRLWGVRVALTTAVPVGTAVTMGQDAAAIYHDGSVKLDWDTSTGFKRNTVDARMEGRYALAVARPDAIVVSTLTGA